VTDVRARTCGDNRNHKHSGSKRFSTSAHTDCLFICGQCQLNAQKIWSLWLTEHSSCRLAQTKLRPAASPSLCFRTQIPHSHQASVTRSSADTTENSASTVFLNAAGTRQLAVCDVKNLGLETTALRETVEYRRIF